MQIKKVGVIGAGQMGNGIAHVLSLGGYHVILNDIDKNTLEKASHNIKNNLERQVNSKKISTEESITALESISYTMSFEEFNDKSIKKDFIHKAIDTLNEREKIIIRLRKYREKSITLDELGQKLKISKERVRQIETKALEK